MIKAIIFDCFGVLQVSGSDYFLQTKVKNYDQLQPEISQIFKAGDYGLMSQSEINQAVAELTGIDVKLVTANIEGRSVRNKELIDFMSELRPELKVALLSNIGPGSMDKFFSLKERQELFDAVVLSGEENTVKPHRRIYEICAERLGVAPGDCVMVDDVIDNCYGADAAGMKYIHHQTNTQTVAAIKRLLQ